MTAFWEDIDAVKLRQDSGLTVEEIKGGTLEKMDTFITERNASNGVSVRKEIDNASGRFTFTAEGFSATDLAGLFPGMTAEQRAAEGLDFLTLAQSAVRFKTLSELEARKTPEPGTTNTMPRFYQAQAEGVMKQIIESIGQALKGEDETSSVDTALTSRTVRVRSTF